MYAPLRYVRLWLAFAKFALLNELSFRGNFMLKMTVEVLWLTILLLFYQTIFTKTPWIAGWSAGEYRFFVGCYFALEGLIETLFLENCQDFSNQVRTGQLDTSLLQPIDEQFLITLRKIDWSTVPNVIMGGGVMALSLYESGWAFSPLRLALFALAFGCAVALAYSFLLMLTSTAVWMVRNQSLMELWWLFTSLIRYPKEIFMRVSWAAPIGFTFTFLLPVMLVVNVPASVMLRAIEPEMVLYLVAATVVMLAVSRWFFRLALRKYRSASS
jgi:ABC-2 type transport system permease protein